MEVQPAFEDHWSPHFVAVKAQLEGHHIYLMNVYAPVDARGREAFYRTLGDIEIPHDVQVYIGGDFNCTQLGLIDRSYEAYANAHQSAEFAQLIHKWGLSDTIINEMPNPKDDEELQHFHNLHHTHQYVVPGRGMATSRLDRWYVNGLALPWVAATSVDQDGLQSDHRGVVLHLRSPQNPIRIHKEKKVFPVPIYARERADKFVAAELEKLSHHLQSPKMTASQSAVLWEEAKAGVALGLIRLQTEARRSRTNTYRGKKYDACMDG